MRDMRQSDTRSLRGRIAALAMVAALGAASLFGCGGAAGSQSGAAPSSAESAVESVAEASSPEEAAATTSAVTSGGTTQAASGEAVTLDALPAVNVRLPTGSRISFDRIEPPEQLDEAETEEVDRAIRAYTPSQEKSLLVNNAKHFYYREKMTGDAAIIYDALLQLLGDPTNDSAYWSVELGKNANEDEFVNDLMLARIAIQYDHPEFFWAYNDLEVGVEAMKLTASTPRYVVTLDKPYKRYEKEMTAFNKAVDDFMADIDTSVKDFEVARQIHDKLIDLVSYDFDVADRQVMDLAHTAYGALVENGSGTKNCAVCDGYSSAFVYLLQQAGINAAVILGEAGETKADMGGHAWAVVELDGEWYEVDATWDDQKEEWLSALDEAKKMDPGNAAIPLFEEALTDESYLGTMQHFMYNLTTEQISSYEPVPSLAYVCSDGSVLQLLDKSVHVRDNDIADALTGPLMDLAPVAKGTTHSFS